MPTSQTKFVHLFWSACQNLLIFIFFTISLSSASSPSLTLSPLRVIPLPCQKDALLSHFAEIAEALSPSTTLITPLLTEYSSGKK